MTSITLSTGLVAVVVDVPVVDVDLTKYSCVCTVNRDLNARQMAESLRDPADLTRRVVSVETAMTLPDADYAAYWAAGGHRLAVYDTAITVEGTTYRHHVDGDGRGHLLANAGADHVGGVDIAPAVLAQHPGIYSLVA